MKNLVLINSKIITSTNSFSYTSTRSIYTPSERLEQTINTINSVKKNIPDYFIILIDNSNFNETVVSVLHNSVDLFINPKDSNLDNDTDVNPTKAIGELAQLLYAIPFIENLKIEWSNLFKICGRYVLNENFQYSNFDNNDNIFKLHDALIKSVPPNLFYYTTFFKIAHQHFEDYKNALTFSYNLFKTDSNYKNIALEDVLCNKINNKKLIDTLGIDVNISCCNEHYKT